MKAQEILNKLDNCTGARFAIAFVFSMAIHIMGFILFRLLF